MVVLERILEILAALALPLAIGELFRRALRWVGAGELQRVPAVNGAANLLGLIVGVLLIVNAGDLALFDWHRFFTTESPWNLPLSAFLAERANPLVYLGAPVARWWTGVAQGQAVAVASAALAGALLAATLAAPYIFWKPPVAAVAMAGAASTAAVRACLTIYFICLGLWALYLLNFWAFALLIVVFQYYRYRASGD